MAKDLVHLMHALFLPAGGTFQETVWRPPADVYRCANGWLIKFDLAGVRIEDIDLSVCGRRLTLRGCRRDAFAEQGNHHYSMEISYSAFERCMELPCDLQTADITSEYRDGMLVVRIATEKNQ